MRLNLIRFVVFISFITSCTKEVESDSRAEIQLDSIIPSTARIGDTVTLYGAGFASITNAHVQINTDSTQIIQTDNDQIKFIVLSKFSTGKVNLWMDNVVTEGPDIRYRYIARVSTIAGTGEVGSSDGQGSSATFNCPWGLAFNNNGDLLVADNYNHRLRTISLSGEPSVSSVYLPNFQFYNPYNIGVDMETNEVFITNFNTKICKLNSQGFGSVYEFPSLKTTTGIAVGADDKVYISDNVDHKVYTMNKDGGELTVFNQSVFTPRNIVVDSTGVYTINSHVMQLLPDGQVKHFKQTHC